MFASGCLERVRWATGWSVGVGGGAGARVGCVGTLGGDATEGGMGGGVVL